MTAEIPTSFHGKNGAMNSVPEHAYMRGLTDEEIRGGVKALSPEKRAAFINRCFPTGKALPAGTSWADAMEMAGANFTVEKRPILVIHDANTAEEFPARCALTRTDTSKALAIVGKDYGIIQNDIALDVPRQLMVEGSIELAAIEVRDGGATIRVTGILSESVIERTDGKPDTLAHFVQFEVSHGITSCKARVITLRMACFNGMTTQDMHANVCVQHTARAHDRMVAANRTFRDLMGMVQDEVSEFQALALKPMTVRGFRYFATALLNEVRGELPEEADESRGAKKSRTMRENDMAELEELFGSGAGNSGSSMWDGFNSVTDWLDNRLARNGEAKTTTLAKKFESNQFGHGNRTKSKALRMLRNG